MTDHSFRKLVKQLENICEQDEVHIPGNIKIPEIYMNRKSGLIRFDGRSLPENARDLFLPVIEWIDQYMHAPQENTLLIFKMEYFNTSTSKMFTEIIKKLKKVEQQGKVLKAEWHYPKDDDDILESGETFEEITGLRFTYIPFSI